jgi:transposase
MTAEHHRRAVVGYSREGHRLRRARCLVVNGGQIERERRRRLNLRPVEVEPLRLIEKHGGHHTAISAVRRDGVAVDPRTLSELDLIGERRDTDGLDVVAELDRPERRHRDMRDTPHRRAQQVVRHDLGLGGRVLPMLQTEELIAAERVRESRHIIEERRVDARTLAQLLRADLLGEAWIAPPDVRQVRLLLRHRAALVRLRTVLKSRVRAVLADRGVDAPGALWEGPGRRWLATLDVPMVEREVIEDLCGLLDTVEIPVARLEREIRARAKPDARVDALQSLPGVGLLTAMTLVAEIGDVARFPTARKLCSWSGLTPRVRNSDTKVRHGHISKQGPAAVRFVLGEAAHVAKARPPFADSYESIRRRRGNRIATTGIARRLLANAFHLLNQVDHRIAADRCVG